MKNLEDITRTPSDVSDWGEVSELQSKMVKSVEALSRMAGDVGMAKTVIEYDSDRRKKALARGMAAPLAGGAAVSKAEAEARCSEAYAKELDQLCREHQAATTVLAEHEVLKLQWSTCQSLLAMEREGIRRL